MSSILVGAESEHGTLTKLNRYIPTIRACCNPATEITNERHVIDECRRDLEINDTCCINIHVCGQTERAPERENVSGQDTTWMTSCPARLVKRGQGGPFACCPLVSSQTKHSKKKIE